MNNLTKSSYTLMKKVILVILLFLAGISVWGQDEKLSLQVDSIQFRELADTLEKIFPVRFYYDDEWIDSLVVSVSARALPLGTILENTLAGKGLSYFITDDNRVIITKDYTLRTTFGSDYLEYLSKERLRTETMSEYESLLRPEESTVSDESRIFRIGNRSDAAKGGNAVLSGTITSTTDGGVVPGAIVYVGKLRAGAMTDDSGHYSITIPKGQYQVEYRMMGMKTTKRNVIMYSDGVLDVNLSDDNVIDAVVITGAILLQAG